MPVPLSGWRDRRPIEGPSIKGLHRPRGTAASQNGGQLRSKLASAFDAHDVDFTRL